MDVVGHQSEGYRVSTELYEGPLDLLLALIERAELDITRLALAQVTDQYISYLRDLQERDAAEVSAFLVIAARLLQIKSAALLPRPPLEVLPGEEVLSAEDLAQQLIIYKRFKELGEWLHLREESGLRTYLRIAAPNRPPARADLSDLTWDDFLQAAREVFLTGPDLPPLSDVVSRPKITIREKIKYILEKLRAEPTSTFQTLLSKDAERVEIVVSFLALLELIKRHIVEAAQEKNFAEITLTPLSEWNEEDGELEFGE